VFFPFCSLQYFDVVICRELRAKVCSLSTKVEKTGKLDKKLKSAFFACQTLEDVEHLVWLVVLILFAITLICSEVFLLNFVYLIALAL